MISIGLPNPVNISSNIVHSIQSATVALLNGQRGDVVSLKEANLSTAFGLHISATDHFVVISGNSSLANYEVILSSFQFYIDLPRPANVSAIPRLVDFFVSDGKTLNSTATALVTIIPINDRPFVYFNISDLQLTLLEEPQTHIAKYWVGSHSVPLIPPDTIVDDVDSTTAWEVNISLSRKHPGDSLNIDRELATALNVNISETIDEGLVTGFRIFGIASFDDYKMILLTLNYTIVAIRSTLSRDQLTLDGVYQGADSSIELSVSDSDYARSLPAHVIVQKCDQCRPLRCSTIEAPPNGMKTGGTSTCDNTVTFTCDDCYNMTSGSVNRTCLDHSWTGEQPTCEIIDCGMPHDSDILKYQSATVERTTCGGSVSYSCNECYNMTGASVRTCQQSGTWSGIVPNCTLVYCSSLDCPQNGHVSISLMQHCGSPARCGSAARFRCNPGFAVLGSVYQDCRVTGKWHGVPPSCHEIGQLHLQLLEAGTNEKLNDAELAIYIIDQKSVSLYYHISAKDYELLISIPAEVHVLVKVEADGYLPTSASLFLNHFTENLLQVYMHRQSVPVSVRYIADTNHDILFDTANGMLRLFIPVGAFSVTSQTVLNVTITSFELADSISGLPQLFGVNEGEDSSRVNIIVYAAVHVDVRVANDSGVNVELLRAIHLYNVTLTNQYSSADGPLSTWVYGNNISDLGLWKQNGMPVLTEKTSANIEIFQLGWWALATEWTDTGCVTVRVQYSSSTTALWLSGSTVSVTGIDFSYATVRETNEKGEACVELRSNHSHVLQVVNATRGLDSGPILINISNSGHCDDKQRWLTSIAEGSNCSTFDIHFAYCGDLTTPAHGSKVGMAVVSVLGDVNRPAVTLFECDIGYHMGEFAETTQSKRICLANGSWDGSEPECKVVNCKELETPTNGKKDGFHYSYGQTIRFKCNPGYHLVGTAIRTCQANGEWNGTSTTCKPRDCGPFPSVKNGSIIGNSTKFPNSLSVFCKEGYEVIGLSTVTCRDNGLWNPSAANCNRISCEGLPAIENGRKNVINCTELEKPEFGQKDGDANSCSSIVHFSCIRGYKLEGSSFRKCQNNGTWSGQQPVCKLILCRALSSPVNGFKIGSERVVDAVVAFNCSRCYQLHGQHNLTCLQEEHWSGEEPNCNLIRCDELSSPVNGGKIEDGQNCGDIIRFFCNGGHVLDGSEITECLANRSWSNDPPSCRVVDCGEPESVGNGLPAVGNSTIVGSVKKFACRECFELEGSQFRYCQEDGQWNGSVPTCNVVKCPLLFAPNHGVIHGSQRYWECNSTVTFSCQPGYQLTGNSGSTCLDSGNWNSLTPECTNINECISNPCQNGGTCIDEIDGYTCFCALNFVGDLCDMPADVGTCAVQDCNTFVEKATESFKCDETSYIQEFLSPFCGFTSRILTGSDARNWARSAWGCLVKVSVSAIENLYGGSQSTPLGLECQEFDRIAFDGQKQCLQEDLCSTAFTTNDAADLVNVLESSNIFRDRNFNQMLDLLKTCGKTNMMVASLRDEMEKRGFIFCVTVDSIELAASILRQFRELITLLLSSVGSGGDGGGGSGSNSDVSEVSNAASVCELSGRRISKRSLSHVRLRRNTPNDTETEPVVVAIRSNGTAAISHETLCNMQISTNLSLSCPVCGDGVLQLPSEVCDDGNDQSGDGCSSNCTTESGYGCNTIALQTTQCKQQICGDGMRVPGEECDNGDEVGCDNCTLSAGFVCFQNNLFNKSLCTECGNNIIDEGEECDNGLSVLPDGCNDTCHQLPFFICYGNFQEKSVCRHFNIDLDKLDNTTRNLEIVYSQSHKVVFLVDNETLDASEYGNYDWKKVQVTLTWANSVFQEKIGVIAALDAAVSGGRLSELERNTLGTAVFEQDFTDVDRGEKSISIERKDEKEANLTHVLFSLFYRHDGQPDYKTRRILIEVFDVNGLSADAVEVMLSYVGENLNPPVIAIEQNSVTFVEGSDRSVSVTEISLNLSDVDHEYYKMQSGKVAILQPGNAERLYLTMMYPGMEITTKNNGTVIEISGSASTAVYAEIFNNVSYFNWERNKAETTETIVQFEVSDGVNVGLSAVSIIVVAVNDGPLVDLGIGVGKSDGVEFIEQQVTGVHIVSRPFALKLSDPENHSITSISIALRSNSATTLDTKELIYYLDGRPPGNVKYLPSPSARFMMFEGIAPVEVYEYILTRVFYANMEDEPIVHLNDSTTEMIQRFIEINVTDAGSPPASSIALSYVHIVFKNDHPPMLALQVTDNCIVSTVDSGSLIGDRKRREAGNPVEKFELSDDNKDKRRSIRQSPSVVSVEAVALVDGFISAGSSLHIRFSHSTNMPSVLDQSDLYKIISLSPPSLHEASTVAGWKDNRTLVVVFPSFQNGITSMENISEHNITVSFSQSSDSCGGGGSCVHAICHAEGNSCHVTGSYRIGHSNVKDVTHSALFLFGLLLLTLVIVAISSFWKWLRELLSFGRSETVEPVDKQTFPYVVPPRLSSGISCDTSVSKRAILPQSGNH
ncbi:uncharacterized protein LOC134184503 isoform X3 [Corticium candelabrum]|uniref:uncharacterized protein LOC134184503 isoform X3 n=1 Tax=Corticium candelabrum TaxID=121492 RepID=UPI002E32189C|nr:uncharacterized protein LOC134184503 isoform X3 [Corticium candelabrum]